jgi:hypothetical protein
MAYAERTVIMREIERLRGSHLICYLTSLRPGTPSQMAEDQVRVFFDHLQGLPQCPAEKLDIFLCSNGGNGTVPWRLVALFREYAKSFNVLIPYRAYSAASLLALGADEIVMHPFAELGPIDPTVSNEYNPVEGPTGRRLGISVEDVRAYVSFIKDTVGITHEDELVQAIKILAEKVHPLSLGNVERFVMQSRMIAKKILKTHMGSRSSDHEISEIVETMASKLYFHGHPINRREAREDLKLKVAKTVPQALETQMWSLYRDFETEFRSREEFNPAVLLANAPPPAAPGSLRVTTDLLHAIIEDPRLSSACRSSRRYIKTQVGPGQYLVEEEILSQGWTSSTAPVPAQAGQSLGT